MMKGRLGHFPSSQCVLSKLEAWPSSKAHLFVWFSGMISSLPLPPAGHPSLNGGKRETFSAAFHNNFPPLTDSVPNQTQPNVFILFIQLLASYSFSLQLGDDLELFCIFPFINNNYQFCLLSPSQPKEKSCLKVADFVFPRLIPNSFFVMWRMEPGLHVCQGSTLNYTPTPKFTFIKMYALSVDFL
jgi:hypothetical protein